MILKLHKIRPFEIWPLVAMIAIAIPLTVHGEVMDKEMSIADIKNAVFISLLVCVIAAIIWRWLLVLSFLYGLVGLAYAWTEWHDPYVGPAIRAEAGDSYGIYANMAVLMLLAAHGVTWHVSTRWSFVARTGEPKANRSAFGTLATFIYSSLIASLTLFCAYLGYDERRIGVPIWVSPPMLMAGAIFFLSATLYFKRRLSRSESQ